MRISRETRSLLIRLLLCQAVLFMLSSVHAADGDWRKVLRLSIAAGTAPEDVAIRNAPPSEPFPVGPRLLTPTEHSAFWIAEDLGDRSLKLFAEGGALVRAIPNPIPSQQVAVSEIFGGTVIRDCLVVLDNLQGHLWRWDGDKWREIFLPPTQRDQVVVAEKLMSINGEEVMVVAREQRKDRSYMRETTVLRLFLLRDAYNATPLPLPTFPRALEMRNTDAYPEWVDSDRNVYWGIRSEDKLKEVVVSTTDGRVTMSFPMDAKEAYRFAGIAGKWGRAIGFAYKSTLFEGIPQTFGMTVFVDAKCGKVLKTLCHPMEIFGYPIVSKERRVQPWLTTCDGRCFVPVCRSKSWELWEATPDRVIEGLKE